MLGEEFSSTSDQEQERLRTALRESEILRELAELLASSLDLNRILQVLTKRTTEVCEVERCAVWLLDNHHDMFLPATYYLSTQQLSQDNIRAGDRQWYQHPLPFSDPVLRRLLAQNGMLALEDLQAEPSLRQFAKKFLVRSTLLVALIREGRTVGMMSLDDPNRQRTFSLSQQQLARAIGQQAAQAIDNAQLYQQAQEERKRAERLIERARAIYQVALTVNSGESLLSVLAIASEHLAHGLSADSSAVALLHQQTLHVITSSPQQPTPDTPLTVALHDIPTCYQAASTGIPQYVTSQHLHGFEKHWFHSLGLSNVMVVPLIAGVDPSEEQQPAQASRCVGFTFIGYQNAQHRPTRGQYAFAQDIAAQCALAIGKERLLSEARQSVALATERANTLDAIFQAMTEGITVLNLDGEVVVRNNAASYFLGLPMNATASLHSFLARFPTYTMRGQPIMEEDFPLSRALRGENIRGERFVTRRIDGVERVVEVSTSRLLNSEQELIGIVSAFRDVTEQTRAERRIRKALETMLHVAEAVSGVTDIHVILRSVLTHTLETLNCDRGIVLIYDQERNIFAPLFSVGYTADSETQWITDQDLWLNPSARHEFHSVILDGHATVINADRCPDQPQPHNHIAVLAAPITHSNHLLGLMMLDRTPNHESDPTSEQHRHEFSIWDMAVVEGIAQLAGLAIEQTRWQQEATTAHTREEAMREANALKDEFLAIAAHEFRSPLTVLMMQAQMAQRALRKYNGQDLPKHIPEGLTAIEEQGRQLTNIVNTFLEVTQLNEGQLTLTTKIVDIADMVQQVASRHSATTTLHEIHCEITPGACPYLVKGDSARLQQILDNLLQNAIKYSDMGGPITISLRQSTEFAGNTFIEICVADKGPGIPKAEQTHLFERFYRVPGVKGSKTRGVGLGLYIVAQLIHLHGGTIHVESNGIPGEGSRFIFTLPALESENQIE
ncbi:MAG TPA: GAF domain-containing protein [Ktedonobacteraceae bacterium]|nr:GAF domain-containing protein [Ktedonobacteraceae bacterium]